MRRGSVPLLVACGALFGLSYVFVRAVVPVLGPVPVTAGRTLIGGVLLLVAAVAGRHPLRGRPLWSYAILGVLSAAAPFTLISAAMLSLNAGTAAVLNASTPAFALAIEASAARRWPTRRAAAGLVVSWVSVAVVMAQRELGLDRDDLIGLLLGLAGAAVFAYGAAYAARRFGDVPPLTLAAGQQLGATAALAPALLVVPAPTHVTGVAVVQLAALGVLGSGLAYLLFYRLIDREGPVYTSSVTLLVPLFGVGWGWLLLDEPVPPLSLLGMAGTLLGLRWMLTAKRPL
ncbi:DMT family transporter [Phytohabitans sp. ZYX-F-186]|uniref:DMT family transporter n=1 Tax=Phytohabitans maris TaxID=3071409 RepID=A0ABU0ZFS7_9ACTN|nr:DMT family transporter [Phytohabitans sp. ZYX-F-186]MDQ7904807.1 DMT family transporter [Phytohabitans sp. ZYX-F-186]